MPDIIGYINEIETRNYMESVWGVGGRVFSVQTLACLEVKLPSSEVVGVNFCMLFWSQ